MTLQVGDVDTPWGTMWVVADGQRLLRTYLPGTPMELVLDEVEVLGKEPQVDPENGLVARAREQLQEYVAGQRTEFDLPLADDGTGFQKDVWHTMRDIPYGETRTYAELADASGHPRAARAVGQANAHNPLPIIVPCHRVIASDGSLGGYMGEEAPEDGLKAALLRHEGAWAR